MKTFFTIVLLSLLLFTKETNCTAQATFVADRMKVDNPLTHSHRVSEIEPLYISIEDTYLIVEGNDLMLEAASILDTLNSFGEKVTTFYFNSDALLKATIKYYKDGEVFQVVIEDTEGTKFTYFKNERRL